MKNFMKNLCAGNYMIDVRVYLGINALWIVILLACNEGWSRFANKQNKSWAELCRKINRDWYDICTKLLQNNEKLAEDSTAWFNSLPDDEKEYVDKMARECLDGLKKIKNKETPIKVKEIF